MKAVAILLAAGESSRMGRPKPLLPWGNRSLIQYQVAELVAGGVQEIIVVLGHRAGEIKKAISGDNVKTVINRKYRQGRASSLKAGAQALPSDTEAVLILNVDQPRPRQLISALLAEHNRGSLITMPAREGRRGHPPILASALIPELRAVEEERQGLREVILRHSNQVTEMPWEDDVIFLDMNTPRDYEGAKISSTHETT